MNQGPLSCQRPCGFKPRDLVKIAHCRTVHMTLTFKSLCEFTGSDWGLWFSSRKCRLYKLGTQENLAPGLRKTPPYLNCIVLQLRYQTCWKPLQVTATLNPVCGFEFFDQTFRKCPVHWTYHPLIVAQDNPQKNHFNKCKVVKLCCLFVGGCWLTLQKYTQKNHKRMRNFIGSEKEKCCSWHGAGNHGYLKENHVEWLGFFKLYGRFELKTDILLYQHGRPKNAKWLQTGSNMGNM